MSSPSRRERVVCDGSAPKRRRIISEPKHFDLLRWRTSDAREPWTPERLAASLTVEGLPSAHTPPDRERQLVEFRHLRSDQRVSVCRSFLEYSRPVRLDEIDIKDDGAAITDAEVRTSSWWAKSLPVREVRTVDLSEPDRAALISANRKAVARAAALTIENEALRAQIAQLKGGAK